MNAKNLVLMFLPLLLLESTIPAMARLNSVRLISYRRARKIKNGPPMCAMDPANETISTSMQDCSIRCARDVTCTGFNIKNSTTCDVYNYKPMIKERDPTCEFHQKIADDSDVNCLQFGDDATSIPSQCCVYPYTLNGELYYNCTVNQAINNDFGCYHSSGDWVTCQQPEDYVAKYEETSTAALSANPSVAVPLLTINGWILMQRKVTNGSMSFNQNWAEYRDGFGSAAGNDNYWLGLDKVYRLVQMGSTRLRVEIQRDTGLWYSAEYSTFSISDEVDKYRLTVTGYSGDAGDALTAAQNPVWNGNGMMFSTPDSDNDLCPCSCAAAATNLCGWWFGYCSTSTVNLDSTAAWTIGSPVADVVTSRMLVKLN